MISPDAYRRFLASRYRMRVADPTPEAMGAVPCMSSPRLGCCDVCQRYGIKCAADYLNTLRRLSSVQEGFGSRRSLSDQ